MMVNAMEKQDFRIGREDPDSVAGGLFLMTVITRGGSA
jgi:hypothetical protein